LFIEFLQLLYVTNKKLKEIFYNYSVSEEDFTYRISNPVDHHVWNFSLSNVLITIPNKLTG